MGVGKNNNPFTHSFVVRNGGEGKSHDDDDEHCGT